MRFTPTPVGTAGAAADPLWGLAVHPHACGDSCPAPAGSILIRGSPPRLWGQLRARRPQARGHRFTPTPVGTAPHRRPACPSPTVHPHACGDSGGRFMFNDSTLGSPPRLWGQLQVAAPPRKSSTVHPQACGDSERMLKSASSSIGSPPRLWGQPVHRPPTRRAKRFTPTPVGTATGCSPRRPSAPVHPHACGDSGAEAMLEHVGVGSPPRLWGQRTGRGWRDRRPRFTPTPVGTARGATHSHGALPVHPHACGDSSRVYPHRGQVSGSPPRLWGLNRPGVDGECGY